MFIKQLKKERENTLFHRKNNVKKRKKDMEAVGLEPITFLMADGHASSEPREPKQSAQKKMA